MKTIQSLVISVFTILLISSCDSSTSADTQEGERIGTFMVYDNKMNWVGVQSQPQAKSKTASTQAVGDTAFFDYPDGKALVMVDEGELFSISYIDSAFSKNSDIIPKVHIINTLFPNHTEWPSYGTRSDHMEYSLGITVNCDSFYSHIEDFVVDYYAEVDTNSTHLKTVVLNTQGIVSAAKNIRCNQAP